MGTQSTGLPASWLCQARGADLRRLALPGPRGLKSAARQTSLLDVSHEGSICSNPDFSPRGFCLSFLIAGVGYDDGWIRLVCHEPYGGG